MFCSACGKKLVEGAKFCMYCGNPVILPEDAPAEEKVTDIAPVGEKVVDTTPAEETLTAPVEEKVIETAPTEKSDTAPVEEKVIETAPAEKSDTDSVEETVAQTAPVEKTDANIAPAKPALAPKKKFSGKKLALIITASVLAAVLVWIGVFFAISAILKGMDVPIAIASEAYISNGKAYFVLSNGECAEIGGGVKQAIITPSEEYAVVIYDDNSMYLVEIGNEKNKSQICSSSNDETYAYTFSVSDEMVIYYLGESVYRYKFEDKESVLISNSVTEDYSLSPSSDDYPEYFTAVSASAGSIYLLGRNDTEKKKIASYTKTFTIANLQVSADAKTVVWTETNPDTDATIAYIWQDGEKSTLGSFKNSTSLGLNTAKNSKTGAIVVAIEEDTVFIKKPNEQAIKKTLSNSVYWEAYCTNGVPVSDENKLELEYGFFLIGYDKNYKFMLYLVDQDGNYKVLKSKLSEIMFCGGKIIYTDDSGVLYASEFDADEMKLTDGERIDGVKDTGSYYGSQSNDYFFYTKTDSSGKHSLNVYEVKNNETYLVDSDILLDDPYDNVMTSPDGKKIYYFTDAEYQGGVANVTGTLWEYDARSGQKTEIAKDVVVWSLKSSASYLEVDPNAFCYEVLTKMGTDKQSYTADIYFFNGEDSEEIITNMPGIVPGV